MTVHIHDRSLKAFSLLLSYPTVELQEAMPDIGGVLAAESRLTGQMRRDLRPLIERLGRDDIYELQETYVALFDRSRTLSLNLFEHVLIPTAQANIKKIRTALGEEEMQAVVRSKIAKRKKASAA